MGGGVDCASSTVTLPKSVVRQGDIAVLGLLPLLHRTPQAHDGFLQLPANNGRAVSDVLGGAVGGGLEGDGVSLEDVGGYGVDALRWCLIDLQDRLTASGRSWIFRSHRVGATRPASAVSVKGPLRIEFSLSRLIDLVG